MASQQWVYNQGYSYYSPSFSDYGSGLLTDGDSYMIGRGYGYNPYGYDPGTYFGLITSPSQCVYIDGIGNLTAPTLYSNSGYNGTFTDADGNTFSVSGGIIQAP